MATPDAGKYEDIVGALSGKFTGKVKMTPPSAANAAPKYGKILQACGMIGAAHSTTGYSYTPLKSGERVTMTWWIIDVSRGGTPTGIAHKLVGCMGSCKIGAAGVGKPVEIEFTFTGKIAATADLASGALATLVVFNSADTVQPYILTNATMVAVGTTQAISSFSLDIGNEIQPEINTADATGYDLFAIAERNPVFNYNPLKQSVAVYDMEDKVKTMVKGSYTLTLDKAIDVKFTVCNGQPIAAKGVTREGAQAWDTTVKCLRNGIDGSVTTAGIVVEAPYEILFGSK